MPRWATVSVVLELRAILNVCNVHIRVEQSRTVSHAVEVDTDATSFTLTVRPQDGEPLSTCLILPPGYSLTEDTCSKVKQQVCSLEAKPQSFKRKDVSLRFHMEGRRPPHDPVDDSSGLCSGRCYMFRCRNCNNELFSKKTTFRRVLPLPSSDWKEMAAEWFCHRHTGGDGGDVPSLLVPGPDELFTSVVCFSLHKSTLCNVENSSVGELQCENCHEVISKAVDSSSTTVEVLRARVDVWAIDGSSLLLPRTDAASVLRHLIREQLALSVSCRIILESGDSSLLVWVMETGLCYYKATDLEPGRHPVQFTPVTKVLYRVADRRSALVQSWLDDALVAVQPVDARLFQEATQMLDASRTEDTLDDFAVGFIPERT